MDHIVSPSGVRVSFETYGSGPPLVLVHGSFSDHRTNWEFVAPLFATRFTVHAVARRGRGDTAATEGHSLEDEAGDVVALINAIDRPVFLLGHSHGAQVALSAAAVAAEQLRKLVLYEPPWPRMCGEERVAPLEALAKAGDWEGFATAFFRDTLCLSDAALEELRGTALWPSIVSDAKATLGDLRALGSHPFEPDRFRGLRIPVMLQVGTESPRDFFVTDALASALPDVRIEELPGQGHDGMMTAPDRYAESVSRFFRIAE